MIVGVFIDKFTTLAINNARNPLKCDCCSNDVYAMCSSKNAQITENKFGGITCTLACARNVRDMYVMGANKWECTYTVSWWIFYPAANSFILPRFVWWCLRHAIKMHVCMDVCNQQKAINVSAASNSKDLPVKNKNHSMRSHNYNTDHDSRYKHYISLYSTALQTQISLKIEQRTKIKWLNIHGDRDNRC